MAPGTTPGGRSRRLAVRAGLALAGLVLVCAGLFAHPAHAQSTDPIWSATMTVGESSKGGRGFNADVGTVIGSLDNEEMTYNSTTTFVTIVFWNKDEEDFTFDVPHGGVGFDESHANGLVLEVAGVALPFSGGDRDDSRVEWTNTWLTTNAPSLSKDNFETTLAVDAEVVVCLRTGTQTCRPPVAVSIEATHDTIGGGLEDLEFELERAGETTAELSVTVTLAQAEAWLDTDDLVRTVTFGVDEAEKTLTIEAGEFSFAPTASGDLTATVSGTGVSGTSSDTVMVVSTAEAPLTVGFEESEYTFEEDDADPAVSVVVTLDSAYPRAPTRSFSVQLYTAEDTASNFTADYLALSVDLDISASRDFELDTATNQLVSRWPLPDFHILDDDVYEGTERFELVIDGPFGLILTAKGAVRFANPDGSTCAADACEPVYPVFITDEEDRPALFVSAAPMVIAEEDDTSTTDVSENVSTVTVGIAGDGLFAADQMVTLDFTGTATEGTHYSVSPTDADGVATGYQVALPVGERSVAVTLTAVGNDTTDGDRSVTVSGLFGETAIGTTTVTIVDDETTAPANNAATGKPTILGAAQVGRLLTVARGTIDDADGLPDDFPGGYTFQWVRVNGSDETIVGSDSTYMPTLHDTSGTLLVRVGFIDGAGNRESRASDATTVAVTLSCAANAVWCTRLVVGKHSGGTLGYCGTGAGANKCDYGALDDDDFTLDGTGYTVESVRWPSDSTGSRSVHLTLDQDFPSTDLARLELRIGAHRYALADAVRGNDDGPNSPANNYRWDEGAPSQLRTLPDNTQLTVQLLEGTAMASNVATLDALAVTRSDGSAVALSPAFASTTYGYTASVVSDVRRVTVTAVETHEHAVATLAMLTDLDPAPGFQVDLQPGANALEVDVTAENGATQRYTVTVTREAPLPVTIETDTMRIGGGLEDLVYTLKREGETTAELSVTVTFTQDQAWLSSLTRTVTFGVGEDEKTLTIGSGAFSLTPETTGNLTAEVSGTGVTGGSVTVVVVSTEDPAVTVGLDMAEYTFDEDAPASDVAVYLEAKLHPDYPRAPASQPFFSLSTESKKATFRKDFEPITQQIGLPPAHYERVDGQLVVRRNINLKLLGDTLYEGDEHFIVKLEQSAYLPPWMRFRLPDGTIDTGAEYRINLIDNDPMPSSLPALSADPGSIAEEDDDTTMDVAENVATLTVTVTGATLYGADQTVTLVFTGSATEGTHYTVDPADADADADDYQVVLPAADPGDERQSVSVTLTAQANDTADGHRDIVVDGTLGETAIRRTFITILDDDGTTTNTDATGAPAIEGRAHAGEVLTAVRNTIADDTDGLPATFPDDYTFEWVRVDDMDEATVVGSHPTYTVQAGDVDHTIVVRVRFIDDAGNPEGPLVSAAVGPVTLDDLVAPSPESAEVPAEGNALVLTFDEPLDFDRPDPLPPPGAFTVKMGAAAVAVSAVNAVGPDTLVLTPRATLLVGETVTVSYRVPASGAIRDAAGNEAAAFEDFPVTNDSTVVDPRGAVLTPPALEVGEGATESYTIALTEAPTGTVTVDVGGAGAGVRVSPASLTFTTGDWSQPQTVEVTADEDDNAVDEEVTLTHTPAGGGYGDATLPDLVVTVADNDGGIEAGVEALTLNEGGIDNYTLKLTRRPTSNVSVTVTVTGDAGKVSVPSEPLVFTADNWNMWQSVTVAGVPDADKNDETVTLRHTATGGGYVVGASDDALNAPVEVTVEDDEATAPGAPALEAGAGNGLARLSWTAPDDNGGSRVTGYEFRQGTGPAQAAESLTGHTVRGLTNGTEYRFQVRAVNRVGAGAWSGQATAVPVPLRLTVEAVADEVTEGEPVRYRIVMSEPTGWISVEKTYRHEGAFMRGAGSGRTGGGIRSIGGALAWEVELATVDDDAIEAHGRFTVRLEPGDGYAVAEPSEATVRILDNDGGAAPGRVPGLVVSTVSPTMLDATWGAAAANGAPLTGYEVEYRAGTSPWTPWKETIGPAQRTVRLTGLAMSQAYQVRVRARNARGAGPWSAVVGAETASDPGVTVTIERGPRTLKVEGATLAFTVRAAPAPAAALGVGVRVTETVDMLAGSAPTSVTIPAGRSAATFEVRTLDDSEDEGDSEVTAALQPSVDYLLGEARSATYTVRDDEEDDTTRGRVLRPRVESILDPRTPAYVHEALRARGEAPIRVLRFAWDAPSDVALAHVFAWEVQWAEVADCTQAAPPATQRWPGRSFWLVEELERIRGATEDLLHVRAAAHFRVRAQLLGTRRPGPWTAPVCGVMTPLVSAQGGASAPVVTEARIVSAPGGGGVWRAGDVVEAQVRLSEVVTVDTSGGVPTLAVVLGSTRREAVYVGGSDTQALLFRHTVGPEDDGARTARVVAGGLARNGATVRGTTGVDAVLDFVLTPVVTRVAVEADPNGDGMWSPGEAVTVTVAFSDVVEVRTDTGTPSVAVLLAGGVRGEAAYAGGSGTAELAFAYEVTAAGGATRSVLVPENALARNGGVIAGPTGLVAVLAHGGVGLVGQPPPPSQPALSVADASATEGAALAFEVTLAPAASETVRVDWTSADATARAGADYEAGSGRLEFAPGETAKTLRIAVHADAETEGAETLRLVLSNAVGARLAGARATGTVSDPPLPDGPPPAISIADATAEEGPGAALAFAVTLDGASSAPASVEWETRDISARAGEDYVGGSGRLEFAPGETAKTLRIAVLDDAVDEHREVMLVVLSSPVGATIAKGWAGGTIENSDPMPSAWLARFGRTAAEQVLDAVEGRLRGAPAPGVRVTVAGQRLGGKAPDARAREEAEARESLSAWLAGETQAREGRTRTVTPRALLTGSSFALTVGSDEPGGEQWVSLWGRGAVTRFDGREDEVTLAGEVGGVQLGADFTRARWTAGLVLSHARGEGEYRSRTSPGAERQDRGEVVSTLTGLYPYGRYALTDRVTVWGTAGYGAGALTLTRQSGEAFETDMDLAMAAAGVRGVVIEAPAQGGPQLEVTTDALGVRTASEAVTGAHGDDGGNLAGAETGVTRLRLGLEGTWSGLALGSGTLGPRLEVGVRHDGGDAETGFGLDLGGGLAWSDPATGIRAEASGRGLLTHESSGFGERGFAGAFGWDPRPGTDRGPSLTVRQALGVSASGGADALLGRTTLAGLAANDDGDALGRRRLEVKLGYGFRALGDRFTAVPELRFGLSAGARDYRLGWRLTRAARFGGALELALEGRRRESAADDAPPKDSLGFRITTRW